MAISLLTPLELRELLQPGAAEVVIIDTRPLDEYQDEHIAGAIHVAWEDWCDPPPPASDPILREPGYWGVLADPIAQSFEKRIRDLGIGADTQVVVYADSARSKGREGRVAWMLLYLGVGSVSLLNGGWNAWMQDGGAVASGNSGRSVSGSFELSLQSQRRRTLQELLEEMKSEHLPLMIDTRSLDEFEGRCFDYQPRKGRIPQSVLFPFKELFDDEGRFITRDKFVEMFSAITQNDSKVVAYCEVGVRASTFALLHEIYTGQIIPVFDGSIMEWGFEPNVPTISYCQT
jgi:thiosulfate/3-mercaptopyruvate sulfurtransferase